MAGIENKTKTALKARFSAIKDKLPDDWKHQLIEKYPEYDSFKMANMLKNVATGLQAPSEELCERIEGLLSDSATKEPVI